MVDVTDTTVVYTPSPQIHYRHDRRVQDGRVCYVHDRRAWKLQTRPSCTRRSCMLRTRPPQDGDTHQPNYYH